MLVERLHVRAPDMDGLLAYRFQEPKTSLYKPALDAIKTSIKTSTSSMTAVPKPLKFLRPHYDELVALFEMWEASPEKVRMVLMEMYWSDFSCRIHWQTCCLC